MPTSRATPRRESASSRPASSRMRVAASRISCRSRSPSPRTLGTRLTCDFIASSSLPAAAYRPSVRPCLPRPALRHIRLRGLPTHRLTLLVYASTNSVTPMLEGLAVMTSSPTVPAFTLTRPQAAPLDPPPLYAQLREEQPVTRVSLWEGRLTPWLVTRWEDARAVLGSPAFSTDQTHPGAPNFKEGTQPGPRGFFQNYDDPIHAAMRRTLTREFMIKRVDALRPAIARMTDELLTGLTELSGPTDFVEHFALPLPSLVICELLGVPYEEHPFFQEHSRTLVDLNATERRPPGVRQPQRVSAATRADQARHPRRRRSPGSPHRSTRASSPTGRRRPGRLPAVRRARDHREHDRARHHRPPQQP